MSEWPELDVANWAATRDTLHMWTQMAGKIRMALAPPLNHWWHVTLYVSARGLTTSPMPLDGRSLELVFDFAGDRFRVLCSDESVRDIPLRPQTTADFYAQVTEALRSIGAEVKINTLPSEVPNPIRFEADTVHAAYDAEAVKKFWRALLLIDAAFNRFRWRFVGKQSPVHLCWGGLDLAHTRFSGRPAPPHPGSPGLPLAVQREGYSHELWSAGFWLGGPGVEPSFYAYAYPSPDGFARALVQPAAAGWGGELGEFLMPYEAVRTASDPEAALLQFLQSTYGAAADLASWDRRMLERPA